MKSNQPNEEKDNLKKKNQPFLYLLYEYKIRLSFELFKLNSYLIT
jgi:hypothetical protein